MDEIEMALVVEEMQKTDGWKIVAAYIQERIAAKEAELLNMPVEKVKIEKVKALKIEREAYRSIFRYIDTRISEGKAALQRKVPP